MCVCFLLKTLMIMTLELIPQTSLIFKGSHNRESRTNLKLTNTSNERITFKIKTTAPKVYSAYPKRGFMAPLATIIRRKALSADEELNDAKHHNFMVQWTVVSKDYTDTCENFWQQDSIKLKDVNDSKLQCVYVDEQSTIVTCKDPVEERNMRESEFDLLKNHSKQLSNTLSESETPTVQQSSVTFNSDRSVINVVKTIEAIVLEER
ncbi:unnamed protein product [Rotaria sordida]|uniref:MSP domain-containing protein n=1 Tax=Rotaria sordida TaxID=392033 RepID=A0A814HTL8_9BILA|nr:unnamed protein product [Rotaria sordida]